MNKSPHSLDGRLEHHHFSRSYGSDNFIRIQDLLDRHTYLFAEYHWDARESEFGTAKPFLLMEPLPEVLVTLMDREVHQIRATNTLLLLNYLDRLVIPDSALTAILAGL